MANYSGNKHLNKDFSKAVVSVQDIDQLFIYLYYQLFTV